MPSASTGRSAALRSAIERFLQERLDTKLKPLSPDDPKRHALLAQFEFETWIADAARRAGQIQAVTHSLKATHPDARGTSLYRPPMKLAQHPLVGSHCLAEDFFGDVVGNAAALDVYKFLRVAHDGRTLLDLMLAGDPDVLAALSDNPAEAQSWVDDFTGIAQPRGKPASHTQAKQLYWLVGEDPRHDANYHLLAPLYASSLAHEVFTTLNEDRFGDAAKVARQARRNGDFSDTVVHEYPHLAVQKLGGTKPQNISQLNSERRGNNYLLASLPPLWVTPAVKPPLRTDTILSRFARRERVRALTASLRKFLESDPPLNQRTREERDALALDIVEELFLMELELLQLDGGWSESPDCRLPEAETYWLDPHRAAHDETFARRRGETDWPIELSDRFAGWLNGRLNGKLMMDDTAHDHWYDMLREEFKARQREGFYD